MLPVPVRVEPFWLGETEVTREQFAQFLMAEPRWADRPALIRDGHVTSAYLEGWEGTRYPAGTDSLPVVGVSWYAAAAFCSWLTTQLPQYLAATRCGCRVRPSGSVLPGSPPPPENAAFLGAGSLKPAGASQPGPYGQRDLWGNAWEWCIDAYLPVRNLLSSPNPDAADPLAGAFGVERVVKGGSWANSRDDFGSFVRGSQPPDWCTPYTGFRAALVKRAAPGRR